nr:FecR family protein [uncultured Duganella sp.]
MRKQFHLVLLVAALLAGASAGARAGQAGTVVFVTGGATLGARAAVLDAAVHEGDELATGADGYIYVKTVDNGFLVLRPGSKARIVAYHIDDKNPANTRVKFELSSGVARSISGTGVKQARQNFRFNTPVAAIGVRGTDFVVYTDDKTSRVTVVAGGVVVSGFAGGCGPEGGGPCEGGGSRELFAGQAGLMLQVERGHTSPQLLRGQVLSPAEKGPPARADEPSGKIGASGAGGTELNLDAQKSGNVLTGNKQINQAGTAAPNVQPPPEVIVSPSPSPLAPMPQPVTVLPPVANPGPPEVLWGRYAAIAGAAVDTGVNDKLKNGSYANPAFLGDYQIARLKSSAYVAPREGTASFALAASEATLQRTDRAAVPASVQGAFLTVDFGARTFQTGMTVVGDEMRVPVNVSGDVTRLGEMVNSSVLPNVRIKGYLGGANAEEAAYLFQYKTFGVTVSGATSWRR